MDSDGCEDEVESSSKQYENNRFTLDWLSMREKQIKIAINYEKCKRSIPFIEDSELVCKKISELKIKLEEIQQEQRMKTLMWRNGQITDTLLSIVGPKNSKATQSRYSEDQIKCIKDLLQEQKTRKEQLKIKQQELISLEEIKVTLLIHNADMKSKKKNKKGCASGTNGFRNKLEELQRKNQELVYRSQLLARTIHSLSKHYMSKDNIPPKDKNQLQPLAIRCKQVMQSHLDDLNNIYFLIYKIHNLKI